MIEVFRGYKTNNDISKFFFIVFYKLIYDKMITLI